MCKRVALFLGILVLLVGCAKKKEMKVVEEVVPEVQVIPEDTVKEEVPALPTSAEIVGKLQIVHFDFDKYSLRPGDAKILEDNSKIIKEYPDIKIIVEGHCDDRGTSEYNLLLGERRANATKEYIVKLGISADRISTMSYGKERPLDTGHNEEAWSKNRRAEFKPKD
ncbi:MAG: peptidoglycan-associated lipoprotein Pal [Candidatus Stahlbacteria bacterium]|nr:peptidoglycan-associated lipoprotein Pal [Candidatus Stahlbacteria bacterium]